MGRGVRTVAERVYALLMIAYPGGFRESYGAEAVRAFGGLHRDASARGVAAVLRLWVRTVPAVIAGGVRERIEERREEVAGSERRRLLEDLVRDVWLSLRLVTRRPVFSSVTIGLIGLGVGATTMIFSVVYGVVLRPLPYPASDRLVHMLKNESSMPVPDFLDIRERSRTLDRMAAARNTTLDLTGAGEPERIGAALVTADLFGMLGARAYRGRLLSATEYEPGADRVAVLTMGFWLRRWGGDESVIGRTVMLSGEPATVIGVLGPEYVPPEALGLEQADVYMAFDLTDPELQNRNYFLLAAMGRIGPDATFESMRSEMEAVAAGFARQYPDSWTSRAGSTLHIDVTRLRDVTVRGVRDTLWMFLGAVALMLAIASANVANLYLARATERTHEMAVRAALGAGRGQLVVQLLVESTTLAVAGGLLGVILAVAGVHGFRLLDPGEIPRVAEIGVNAPVLAFAVLLSIVTGIVFGLAPALSSARAQAASAIRESGGATTVGQSRSLARGTLVVVQLAMALVLLAGAGILFNSFLKLRGVDPGFDPGNLLTVQLDVGARVPGQQRADFVHRLEDRLARLPGVGAVGTSWRLPFDRGRCCWSSRLVDPTVAGDTVSPYMHPVTPGYLAALDVDVVEGRNFTLADAGGGKIIAGGSAEQQPARIPVIISRTIADRMWPGRSAIGRSLRPPTGLPEYEVIGLVDGVRHWRLDVEPGQDIYLPYDAVAAWDLGLLDIALRHDGRSEGLARDVRDVLAGLDDQLPLDRVAPMEDRIAGSIATPRFYTALLGTFAALAFILAAAGVYGSMLYVVGLRRRELGIRAALGAGRARLLRLVIARGAVLVAFGTTVGIAATIVLSRVLESLTFGVSARDPATLSIVAGLLAATGLTACWLPARRAAGTDPAATLRAS
jgi:putative ABC transport system permease protein